MKLRAIFFDFDGTILDTETPEYVAWKEIYAAHGQDLSLELWATGVGVSVAENPFDPYAHLEQRIGRELDREAIGIERRQRFQYLMLQEKPRPGIIAYLDEAERRGIPCAVVSSSGRTWVRGYLEKLGLLHRFAFTRTADEVTHAKPNPELYLSALATLKISAGEAIAIEDAPNGIKAAKAAGLFCIATPNPLTALLPLLPLGEPDLTVSALEDLPFEDLLTLLDEQSI